MALGRGAGDMFLKSDKPSKEGLMLHKVSFSTIARKVSFSTIVAFAIGALVVPATSAAALTVSSATLTGGLLRVDGTNAARGVFVNVYSSSSSAGARSDFSSGAYHIQKANFRADDCQVVVSDGRTRTVTLRLSGCSPTRISLPRTNPAPSGSCVIRPQAPATFNVGVDSSYFFTTTGCNTSAHPVQWSFLAGRIPVGLTGPIFQGQTGGSVYGQPTTEGTYSFMVQVTDSVGATDTETFTIRVVAPRPVTVATTTTDPATVGHSYWIILAADGGMPYYTWALSSGTLPDGLRLTSNGSITGTPTTRGAFSFTVAATDSRGTTADRTLSITVG